MGSSKCFQELNATLVYQLKKKIEELNKEKERYTQLFEQSNDAIILITLEGKIFGINNKTEELTEYREKEIIGKGIFSLFPKEKLKENKKCFMKILKEGSCFNENKIITKSGKIKDIEANAKIIRLKEGTFIQAIFRDITERKRAEETLKESEEKFRAIFENAGEGILIADAKTKKFAFANPRICKILGYKEKTLLKLKVNDIHPKKDLPHVMEQFKKQLQKKILTSSLPVLRKDKKVIFCDITTTPLIINGKECLAGFFLEK